MVKEPEWDVAQSLLVQESNRAIESFSVKHPAELCSCFALCVDYCFGDVVICFDTYDNSLLHAKRHEVQTLKAWDAAFAGESSWANAKDHFLRRRLDSYNARTSEFKFPSFAAVHFSDWEGYFLNDERLDQPDPLGQVIVLMHKVVSDLVLFRSFDKLVLSSPFRIGVEFAEELGLVVMRLLNWPSHQGPRV